MSYFCIYQKKIDNILSFIIKTFFSSVLGSVLLLLAGNFAVAEDYSVIKSIPGSEYEGTIDFRQNAENYYDFIGTVDDVQEEGIVVGDSYMKFAPKAKVSARRGARVGIRLNGAGEVVLCEPYKKPAGK